MQESRSSEGRKEGSLCQKMVITRLSRTPRESHDSREAGLRSTRPLPRRNQIFCQRVSYFRSRSSSSLLPRTIFSNPPSLRLNRLYHSEQDTEEANEIINAINAKQFVAGLPSISKKWRRSTNVLRRRS